MRNFVSLSRRDVIVSLVRLFFLLVISLFVATQLNHDTYNDFYSKRLFRLHTADLGSLAAQMTTKLSFFLDQGSAEGVQSVLDASFGLFGFVITDCKGLDRECQGEKILFTSDLSLPWQQTPDLRMLAKASFATLRRPPLIKGGVVNRSEPAGEPIGRLYVVSNVPKSFSDDYTLWLLAPFSDIGARRVYLRTTLTFLMGAFTVWGLSEFYFAVRRKQRKQLLQRGYELKQAVNRQMKQLAEKDAQITRLNEESSRQYEAYVEKIRALNLMIRNEEEYRQLAEQIIAELEQDREREASQFSEELTSVRQDMERLQLKIRDFEESTTLKREDSYRALEEAVRTPSFSNVFEQKIFEVISSSPMYVRGEWRLLSNYDVAPGRNYRQFTDFVLFNKDAIIIIEAKYYVGLIDSPGDFLNDIWLSVGAQRKKIDCLWGENPYHQLNEYSMSLMKILKQRSPWTFQIFGVILFPDEADLSRVGEHLGKFYRVARLGGLLPLAESIFAEAHRFQTAKNPKRPRAEQVESMLRGRKID